MLSDGVNVPLLMMLAPYVCACTARSSEQRVSVRIFSYSFISSDTAQTSALP